MTSLLSDTLPQAHIQPVHGWLNDPNGMVRLGDRWHVFYQANPAEPVHGDIAWAHVSSPDLVVWRSHPVAFSPEAGGPDASGCWSGTYYPWLDRPAMVYSAVATTAAESTVCVREALDEDLDTFGPPRVVAETPVGVREMRDPFCLTFGGRRIVLLGAQLDDGVPAILWYDATAPLAWQYQGVWLRADEIGVATPEADIWECPQLVIEGERAMLLVSLLHQGSTERVLALAGTLHDEDGVPRLTPDTVGPADAGDVFYAPQVALDPTDEPLLFGWIRDPDADAARARGISGCLTLPRRIALSVDGTLRSTVDEGLQRYADAAPALDLEVGPGSPVALPPFARLRGSAARVTFEGAHGSVEIACPAGGFEAWTDGEVLEVFPAGAPAYTARQVGTEQWRLGTDSPASVTLWELAPPTA